MFSQSNRMREMFAKQFQGDGVDIVYRKDSRAAPVRVSALERDGFIADYRRSTIYSNWGVVIGVIAVIGGVVAIAFQSEGELPQVGMYSALGLLTAISVAANVWAWYAPARALRGRSSSGHALTADEVNRKFFADLSYGKLLGGGAVILIAFLGLTQRVDVLHGWGRLWIAFIGAVLVLLIVQAIRKWRFESASKRN